MSDLPEIKITPVSKESSIEGAWTVYRGVGLKIARNGNPNFKRIFARLSRPHRKSIEQNSMDEDLALGLLCEAISESILVNWKDFKIGDTVIEYSHANAKQLLKNDPDCLQFVQEFSKDLNNYINEDKVEVQEK